jgi:hypothetical protein
MKFISNILRIIFIVTIFNCASASGYNSPGVMDSMPTISSAKVDQIQGGQQKILTYRSEITVEVDSDKLESTVDKVNAYILENKGYIIFKSLSEIQFKIPTESFDVCLKKLETFGTVTDKRVYIDDITNQFYDSKIRLENALKLQQRLIELLTKSKTVQDAIEVEKELSRVTTEIETQKSQLNRLENLSTMSSVTLRIRKKERLGPLGYVFYGIYRGVRFLFYWD